jgi:hypothetical protein
MCSKSNPIVVFALDLMSTYEAEHMIFGLLGQANLTQNDVHRALNISDFSSDYLNIRPTVFVSSFKTK